MSTKRGDVPARTREQGLPVIPLLDVRGKGPAALVEMEPGRVAAIVAQGRRSYGGLALRMGDRATWRWLTRNGNPYRDDIAAVAARISMPGAFLLNLSYEWTCTSGVGPDPGGPGNRMLRTLDWPLPGLGGNVVVARQDGGAGTYYNVTWPGFVGVFTAMAPSRFSAAINQPPMKAITRSCWFDWAIGRTGMWRKSGLPPAHLLRKAFDECVSYGDARRLLSEAPVCAPAFFTLSGDDDHVGCIIERTENSAAIHETPASIANHWLKFDLPGRVRGADSFGRRDLMESLRDTAPNDFSWVTSPILNPTTRLAVVANAAGGFLLAQGWEADGPATQVFTLEEHLHADRRRTSQATAPAERA